MENNKGSRPGVRQRAGLRLLKWLGMSPLGARNWFLDLIKEPTTGAWQRNVALESGDSLLRSSAIYACVTGISSDIGKMRLMLSEIDSNGIWSEVGTGSPFLKILKKPNHYQNRIKFIEQWILSKLLQGNAYILKLRDSRRMVTAMYPLDPRQVTPLVAPDGGVYYQLKRDDLSRIDEDVTVPASEIIHDRMPCLWHPLVGVPPIYACALAGTVGNRIQDKSIDFFTNRAIPGGIITAPGEISEVVAKRIKDTFEKNYAGANVGRLAVLGDGLEFSLMELTAEASQLAEQFKLSVEDIARAFHYPIFKLGGPLPAYAANVDALITLYYTDCLQSLIESLEIALDEGLGLPAKYGTEFDLDNLMRMDKAALYESNNKAVKGGWMMPDEARLRANYAPVAGGATPYMQQQNFSLAALAKRDALEDPFKKRQASVKPKLDTDELEHLYAAELDRELRAC